MLALVVDQLSYLAWCHQGSQMLQLNLIALNAALSACNNSWQAALMILDDMVAEAAAREKGKPTG